MTPRDDASQPDRGLRLPGGPEAETRAVPAADPATQQVPSGSGATRVIHDPRGASATRVIPSTPGREMVGRFAIVEKVGEGGMGVVYRAIDTADPREREVALKVLRPHIAYDPEARTRLAREVQTLERVSHPNVAAVIDADPYGPRPFIATQYVPGVPLDHVIETNGPFDADALSQLGRDLADALRAIHAAGVVHRDLKPSNVLMVGSRPVLIDFGIAHIADDARLTSTGLVMGTPGYLSPELVEGAPVSTSTDWWGWAATLAFAAQGKPPFGRGPMAAVLDRVTRGQADLSGVDERLRPLLAAALSPVPSERPSAREVMRQIDRYAHGEYTTIVPVRPVAAPEMTGGRQQQRVPRRPRNHGGEHPGPPSTSAVPAVDPTRVAPTQPRREPQARDEHGAETFPRGTEPRRDRMAGEPYVPPQHRGGRREDVAGPLGGAQGAPSVRPKPQTYPGEHDPRIHLPARSGVLQALFLLWAALTTVLPVTGLIVLVLWNVAARFADSTITQTVLRRYDAGRRRSDGAVAVVSSPWHLLRAVVSTAVAFVLPLFVFACVAAITGVAAAFVTGGVPRAWWGLPIGIGAVAGQWTMWRGAGSTTYRRGARSLARGLAPTSSAARICAAVAAGLGVFMLAGSLMQHGDISWAPLTGGFMDPLSEYLPNP